MHYCSGLVRIDPLAGQSAIAGQHLAPVPTQAIGVGLIGPKGVDASTQAVEPSLRVAVGAVDSDEVQIRAVEEMLERTHRRILQADEVA